LSILAVYEAEVMGIQGKKSSVFNNRIYERAALLLDLKTIHTL